MKIVREIRGSQDQLACILVAAVSRERRGERFERHLLDTQGRAHQFEHALLRRPIASSWRASHSSCSLSEDDEIKMTEADRIQTRFGSKRRSSSRKKAERGNVQAWPGRSLPGHPEPGLVARVDLKRQSSREGSGKVSAATTSKSGRARYVRAGAAHGSFTAAADPCTHKPEGLFPNQTWASPLRASLPGDFEVEFDPGRPVGVTPACARGRKPSMVWLASARWVAACAMW
jgi:hypothetical protein